jgi:UDP-2,3-diacylglucosamine hydrolase
MILFISDVHLSPQRPDITQAFYHFLNTTAANADSLYILGDFFDAWVGDDDDTPVFREIEAALAGYNRVKSGSQRVYFMHGNRDFMIGEEFAERTGITLLDDPTVIELNGIRAMLMHGDSLCTLDQEYMSFRKIVRNPEWHKEIMQKPLAERKALAAQMKSSSQSMNSIKAEDIMDVTPQEVTKLMHEYGASLLIHGHTHRPNRHRIKLDNQVDAERIVLGDWHQKGWYLFAVDEKLTLRSFSI